LLAFCQSFLSLITSQKGKAAKKSKKSNDDDDDEISHGGVSIEMNQHVTLTFSLKYLVNFSRSTSLSDTVQLMMSNDVPLLVRSVRYFPFIPEFMFVPQVSYKFNTGYIRYYLAPKIGDD